MLFWGREVTVSVNFLIRLISWYLLGFRQMILSIKIIADRERTVSELQCQVIGKGIIWSTSAIHEYVL